MAMVVSFKFITQVALKTEPITSQVKTKLVNSLRLLVNNLKSCVFVAKVTVKLAGKIYSRKLIQA